MEKMIEGVSKKGNINNFSFAKLFMIETFF